MKKLCFFFVAWKPQTIFLHTHVLWYGTGMWSGFIMFLKENIETQQDARKQFPVREMLGMFDST